MNKIRDIDMSVTERNENCLYYMLPFGKENMNNSLINGKVQRSFI